MTADYIVVGSGLTGATIARMLADAGRDVLIIERRTHLGGNVHDFVHPSGIRIHTYGPHYFRTSSPRIWHFVNRFSPFYRFEAVVMTAVSGHLEHWPVTDRYIRSVVSPTWSPAFSQLSPTNFEEASLAYMPRLIYERFVQGYTEKQWGVPASSLSARLASRFDVRADDEPRLSRHRWQGLPAHGYSRFVTEMLRGIPTVLNCEYQALRRDCTARCRLIYTGPIDEFFGCDLGRLTYRGQRREHLYCADKHFAQPVVQVNNPCPENGAHIRTIEWKHMMPSESAERIRGTVLTLETPFTPTRPNDFEYPFPNESNHSLYRAYRRRAKEIPRTVIAGRLGEYHYYDMDQAIGRAMVIASRLLGRGTTTEDMPLS